MLNYVPVLQGSATHTGSKLGDITEKQILAQRASRKEEHIKKNMKKRKLCLAT